MTPAAPWAHVRTGGHPVPHRWPPEASDVIEGRLIEIGLRALELGVDVVLDFGLWSRDERSCLRQAAADVGASSKYRS